ncbi:hypothetical protein [Pedobacter ginsengisoli]|uniref:hypothetical protein n=1 Tax=Pedobacter ginsengisoli TaxID=363852 RepID=UPI00254A3F1C|nr:hypothetical protein [Pedobacter ginsengisoli]
MKPSINILTKPWLTSQILLMFLCLSLQVVWAQKQLPIIKASSKTVDIRDGKHFKKGYWAIMPERKPDYYYTEIPEQAHTVTFITDQDSISFDITYEEEMDFIILLNGKDSCLTRISARYRNRLPLTRKKISVGPDTIPFSLGDNSKIYLKGRINNSRLLDIQFDLGAGGPVIKKSSVAKVKMNFDQKVNLANTDGVHQVPSASRNALQMGNLVWDSVGVAVADNMTHREDLIVGNSLFKGKILEINYDKMIMVIHDTLPVFSVSWSRQDLVLDGGVIPFIEVGMTSSGQTKKGWAMFDTGAYTSILNSQDVSVPYRIMGELLLMLGLNDMGFRPKLSIGNDEFSGFNYNVQNMGKNDLHLILGNDVLKRFNIILDNRSGYVYLKANSLAKTPHGKRGEYYLVMAGLALTVVLTGLIIYKRSKRKLKGLTIS